MNQNSFEMFMGIELVNITPMTLIDFLKRKYDLIDSTEYEPGYLITYNDGHESWQSKKVFEDRYSYMVPKKLN